MDGAPQGLERSAPNRVCGDGIYVWKRTKFESGQRRDFWNGGRLSGVIPPVSLHIHGSPIRAGVQWLDISII